MAFSWRAFWEREKIMVRAVRRMGVDLCKKMLDDEFLFLASGLSFNLLLCLIPMLLFFIYVLGLVFQNTDASSVIEHGLQIIFPNQPHAEMIRKGILAMLGEILAQRGSFGALTLVVLLATSGSLFASLRSVLHRVFQLQMRRHFIFAYLSNLLLVMAMTFLILITTSLTWFYRALQTIPGHLPPQEAWFVTGIFGTLPSFIAVGIIFFLCYLLYRYVPEERIAQSSALIAALTTSLVWEVSGRVFGWYIRTLTPFSRLYGAYAFLVVLLVWVFYSAIIFVIGAEVGYLAEKQSEERDARTADVTE